MCGLVGVITKSRSGFSGEQRDIFDMLLWIDTFRGEDSTGAFVVDNLGNVKVAKEATYAPLYMGRKEYQDLRSAMFSTGWAAIGHNRAATRGDITDENAHPFVVDDNIVLVHNGSYNGSHKALKDVEVDSLAIAHTISEAEDVTEALRKVNAAYALIWYNQEEKSLNFIRNTQRPLWMMEYANGWIFASEEAFLQLVRYKFRLQNVVDPIELKEYVHHKFTLQDNYPSAILKKEELDVSYYKHNPVPTRSHPFRQEDEETEFWHQRGAHVIPNYRRQQLACAWELGDGDDDGSVEGFLGSGCNTPHPFGSGSTAGTSENSPGAEAINQITKSVVENHSLKNEEFDTKGKTPMSKLMELLHQRCRTMSFSQYQQLNGEIPDGTKLKVIINDLTNADDNPKSKDYLLVGQTMMNPSLYATFHVNDDNFGNLVANSTNDAVYEIEVNGVSWKCTESQETKQKPNSSMDEWQGVVVVHGKNPQPIFMNENHATH